MTQALQVVEDDLRCTYDRCTGILIIIAKVRIAEEVSVSGTPEVMEASKEADPVVDPAYRSAPDMANKSLKLTSLPRKGKGYVIAHAILWA